MRISSAFVLLFFALSPALAFAQDAAPAAEAAPVSEPVAETTPAAEAVVDPTGATAPETSEAAVVEGQTAAPVAQPAAPAQPLGEALAKEVGAPKPTGIHPNDMESLVFTYWEHTAIKDARRARGMVRPPTDAELMHDLGQPQEDLSVKPPPEERDISLGGIVFVSTNDWTIWLNGKRVTPKALPEEAMDLRVFDEYIELKWFDKYTNQIFPIRLRAHQRFNIDTRIFLPG